MSCAAIMFSMEKIRKELSRIVIGFPVENPWFRHPEEDRSELVRVISEKAELACFDQQLHMLGGSGRSLTFQELADSLIVRSRETSVDLVFDGLIDYLNSSIIQLSHVFLLSQVHVGTDYTFSNKVKLQAIENIENCSLKRVLLESRWGGVGTLNIHSILIAPYPVHKYHFSNSETNEDRHKCKAPPSELLNDTRLMLGLARSPKYGIPLCGSTTLVPARLAFLENGHNWSPKDEPSFHCAPEILEFQMRSADTYISQFAALPVDTRDRLRILLKRFNDAKLASDWVDRFINMRVCLENIFINPGERYGLTAKLKARVPSHSVFSTAQVELYYGELSAAVHGGKLPANPALPFNDFLALIKKMAAEILLNGAYRQWS